MALDSPVAHGFKRTANGDLKGPEGVVKKAHVPLGAHKRNKSMDIHSGSRIGEVCGHMLVSLLQGANAYAAIRTAQDASQLRHGQGAEWLGEAIA
jgi:hypothetical protein